MTSSEPGHLALQGPSLQPQPMTISPATCYNLSLFKDLLKEYRQLDDGINMCLNRTNAQFRTNSGSATDASAQACAYFWQELVENRKRRTRIIEYCVEVVDKTMDAKRLAMNEQSDPSAQRRVKAELYADKVKRNQVHGELEVEKIVGQRSLDAFRSRCKYFEPPLTDAEARKWWNAAQQL